MSKKKYRFKKDEDTKEWLRTNGSSRTNKIYGNCKVYSPSGNLMFLCVEKKAKWYLDRFDKETGEPLAIKIRHINSTANSLMTFFGLHPRELKIQLNFNPKDEGNKGDKYSLAKKENRCVVTGSRVLRILTTHHITPHEYRKFMPDEYKSANSHDVVAIVSDEHYEYEFEADKLKELLAKKYDAPINGQRKINHPLFYAIKSANAIKNYGEGMPEGDLNNHKEKIRKYSGQKRVTQKLIDKLINTDYEEASRMKSHGEIVIEKILLEGEGAMQEFVEMWREHFLKNTKPKYMPKHWDVKRRASRKEVVENNKNSKGKIGALFPFHPFC